MITRHDYIEHFWNGYLLHEGEFISLVSYVDISKQNLSTCSNIIIRQYLSVCVSLEAAFKLVASIAGTEAKKYPEYAKALKNCSSFDENAKVKLLRGNDIGYVIPFADLDPNKAPVWWHNHNKIKHDRVANYSLGTFDALLNSLAALYYLSIVIAKLIGDWWLNETGDWKDENAIDVPNDVSELFTIDNFLTRHCVLSFNAYAMIREEVEEICT